MFRFPGEASGVSYAKKKKQSSKRLRGSRHTIGTAKGVPCIQPVNVLEHELQQMFGAQTLSLSPNLQPK